MVALGFAGVASAQNRPATRGVTHQQGGVEGEQALHDSCLQTNVGKPYWDPVALVSNANPAPLPTHCHFRWW